eukprot:8682480-Karenia_brevis.AAC.1
MEDVRADYLRSFLLLRRALCIAKLPLQCGVLGVLPEGILDGCQIPRSIQRSVWHGRFGRVDILLRVDADLHRAVTGRVNARIWLPNGLLRSWRMPVPDEETTRNSQRLSMRWLS